MRTKESVCAVPRLTEQLLVQDKALWEPTYGIYEPEAMATKLAVLESLVKTNNGDSGLEADTAITQAFIARCFDDFEGPLDNHAPGSFAFVVPPRIRRGVDGENDAYMAEWGKLCPILKHFDSDVAQRFLAGLPPFIVDRYGQDAQERHGYMLCAPMFNDMHGDLSREEYFDIGTQIMNDTFGLARRLEIDTVGLGATLPKFLFRADRRSCELDSRDIELTTGHGGTVWLIGETIKRLADEGYPGLDGKVGILGTGSIGIAVLAHLRENLGYEGRITVYDNRASRVAKAIELGYDNVSGAENERELIHSCDTVVCAATAASLPLEKLGIKGREALKGKIIIDDSQPGCFDPAEVRACGGQLVWVIGQDPTPDGEITCNEFDYNGFGPVASNEIWGCQLEAWAVRKQHLVKRISNLAVRREINFKDVRKLGEFLDGYNVGVARLQAQGNYI